MLIISGNWWARLSGHQKDVTGAILRNIAPSGFLVLRLAFKPNGSSYKQTIFGLTLAVDQIDICATDLSFLIFCLLVGSLNFTWLNNILHEYWRRNNDKLHYGLGNVHSIGCIHSFIITFIVHSFLSEKRQSAGARWASFGQRIEAPGG